MPLTAWSWSPTAIKLCRNANGLCQAEYTFRSCKRRPMLAGRKGSQVLDLNSVFEGVGAVSAGRMTEEELKEIEECACPGCGSCSGMFTANSMNCLSEVLGMALPGNGTIPAVYAERIRLAKEAGMKIMELVENICPRDILTAGAFENALTVDMALGCSTNSVLHLTAIAHEAEIKIDLDIVNSISQRTPNLCRLSPADLIMLRICMLPGVYRLL